MSKKDLLTKRLLLAVTCAVSIQMLSTQTAWALDADTTNTVAQQTTSSPANADAEQEEQPESSPDTDPLKQPQTNYLSRTGNSNDSGISLLAATTPVMGEDTGIKSLAIGSYATYTLNGVDAISSTAIGNNAQATGNGSTALGYSTQATGNNSTALGYSAKATNSNTVAIGNMSKATADSTTAIGFSSNAKHSNSVAIGTNSATTDIDQVSFGLSSRGIWTTERSLVGISDIAMHGKLTGVKSINSADLILDNYNNSMAFGIGVGLTNDSGYASQYALAIGTNAKATADDTTVFGVEAQATNQFATAMGSSSKANGSESTALGYAAQASGNYATALGSGSKATAENAIALGYSARANSNHAIALGNNSIASIERSIALGGDAEASNSYAIAVGYASWVDGNNAIALGANSAAKASYATALGARSSATYSNSVAIGARSETTEANQVNFGYREYDNTYNSPSLAGISDIEMDGALTGVSSINGADLTVDTTNGSMAFGQGATVQDANGTFDMATALGSGAKATAEGTTALGMVANATAEMTTAVGTASYATAERAIALGAGAKTDNINSVAIGTSSETTADNQVNFGYWEYDAQGKETTYSSRSLAGISDIEMDGALTGVSSINGVTMSGSANDGLTIAGVNLKAGKVNNIDVAKLDTTVNDGNFGLVKKVSDLKDTLDNIVPVADNTKGISRSGSVTTIEGNVSINTIGGIKGVTSINGIDIYVDSKYQSIAFGNAAKIKDDSGAVHSDALAIGNKTQAIANYTTALGSGAKATANNTTALGNDAEATAMLSVAVGSKAKATGSLSTALGNNAQAGHNNSVAIGYNSTTNAGWQVAFGTWDSINNKWSTERSLVGISDIAMHGALTGVSKLNDANIGGNATDGITIDGVNLKELQAAVENGGAGGGGGGVATADTKGVKRSVEDTANPGYYTTTIEGKVAIDTAGAITGISSINGADLTVDGNAMAFGTGAVTNNALAATAMGYEAEASYQAATAMGYHAQATAMSTIALGSGTKATADSATALGGASEATAEYATAIGNLSQANHKNSVAIGSRSTTTSDDQVSFATGIVDPDDNSIKWSYRRSLAGIQDIEMAGAITGVSNINGVAISGNAIDGLTIAGVQLQDSKINGIDLNNLDKTVNDSSKGLVKRVGDLQDAVDNIDISSLVTDNTKGISRISNSSSEYMTTIEGKVTIDTAGSVDGVKSLNGLELDQDYGGGMKIGGIGLKDLENKIAKLERGAVGGSTGINPNTDGIVRRDVDPDSQYGETNIEGNTTITHSGLRTEQLAAASANIANVNFGPQGNITNVSSINGMSFGNGNIGGVTLSGGLVNGVDVSALKGSVEKLGGRVTNLENNGGGGGGTGGSGANTGGITRPDPDKGQTVIEGNTTVGSDGIQTNHVNASDKIVVAEGKDNQVTISEDGIHIGKHSTLVNDVDGFVTDKGLYIGVDSSNDPSSAKLAVAPNGDLTSKAGSYTFSNTSSGGAVFSSTNHNTAFNGGSNTNTTIQGNTVTTGSLNTDKLIVGGNEVIIKGTDIQQGDFVNNHLTTTENGKTYTNDFRTSPTQGTTQSSSMQDGDKDTSFTANTKYDGMSLNSNQTTVRKDADGNVSKTTINTGKTTMSGDSITLSKTEIVKDKDGNEISKTSSSTNIDSGEIYLNNDGNSIAVGSTLTGLQSDVREIDNRVSRMGVEIKEVGALSAALAGLHPMPEDADTRTSMAMAIGSYEGKQAVAVGGFYRPNKRTMLSVGGSFTTSKQMFNMGVSFALDKMPEKKYQGAQSGIDSHVLQSLLARLDSLESNNKKLEEQYAELKAKYEKEVANKKAQ